MGNNFLTVRLKDPQPYYQEDESIDCIVELKTTKPLKHPIITIIFKGRSSCYSNFSRVHHVPIFDVEQEIKHPQIDMESSHKRIVSAEFKVEVPKGVSIPSSQTLEVGDGGKIEYMVEAVLDTAGVFKRKVQTTSILVVPMLSRINVDKDEFNRPIEKTNRWPKNEADSNTCLLKASIPRGGWVRGNPVPVNISWMQPERVNSVTSAVLTLIRQELVSSNKDTPPDMTKQLKDKIVTESVKELILSNGSNKTLSTNLQHSVEIPSNVVPTINKNGKVMNLDYKICVTVQIPGMGSNGSDKELSINLPIIVGTEGKMPIMEETTANSPVNNNNIRKESQYCNPGGFRMPEPTFHHYPPNHFFINPEKNVFAASNSEDMPTGMPVPFFEVPEDGPLHSQKPAADTYLKKNRMPTGASTSYPERLNSVNEDPRNNKTGQFAPQPVPDCYPPLESQPYMSDNNISLDPSNYSPMPPRRMSTNKRDSNYNDPYVDDDIYVSQQFTSPTDIKFSNSILYKPEEGSPK